jgi:hypothetical protein
MGQTIAGHRIICIVESTAPAPVPHPHIIGVGTESAPGNPTRRWTLREVLDAIQGGDQFYTRGAVSQKAASVVPTVCSRCGQPQIESGAGFVPDNEVAHLRLCGSD